MAKRSAPRRRRKRHGGEEEEHANHERWLLTYADMITLLMVLFIVMFAVSSVDSQKFKELRDSLAGAFGGSPSVMSGGAKSIGESEGTSKAPDELQPGTLSDADSLQKLDQAAAAKAVRDADRVRASRNLEEAKREVQNLQELQRQITARLQTQGLEKSVAFAIDERGLVINIVTTSVVFPGDSAVLLPEGQQIVAALAPTLAEITNQVEIDGHTNQLPVPTVNYPSSWELSTARASSVVRFLTGHGVPANRMTAAGYADQRPLYPPSDPQSVTKNRRVEVIILSDKPADVRALLASVVANLAKK
ncbi:MAG TPA: flagellar motor protein MotB [Actinophytocola sp.]|uniref:flagellar motor protein MotB n=1 Tax=Actinophytocola sp. TaxID=1872138 RepID=UPI002DBF97D5|nr:flagellar motor protein MotB [Actinophytocola sp.]HEU5474222.1 flagellar motor protein MotB [Actinophytocola sp.]